MIIAGYPGIGKTTLAKANIHVIDLESSAFNKKNIDWFIDYVNVAIELNKQDYDVFISTHAEVLKYLECLDIEYLLIYPSYEIKDEWIEKLEERLNNDNTMKNLKACMRAKDHFDSDISALMTHCKNKNAKHYLITNKDYDLKGMIYG